MSEFAAQLIPLRTLRDSTTDPVQRAALDLIIAKIEAEINTQDNEPPVPLFINNDIPQPFLRDHKAEAKNTAKVGVLSSGDHHGNMDVQMDGQRYQAFLQIFFDITSNSNPTNEQRQLLTQYLERLADRCNRLRLRGIVDWERKRGKAPPFTLSQIYIALASTEWVAADDIESPHGLRAVRYSRRALPITFFMRWFFADLESIKLVRLFKIGRLRLRRGGDFWIQHKRQIIDKMAKIEIESKLNSDEVLPQDARRRDREYSVLTGGKLEGDYRLLYGLEQPLLLTKALSERRRIVVVGGPGSGKSTFLRHLTVALVRAHDSDTYSILPGWEAGTLLPIYISLGGFAAWASENGIKFEGEGLWHYILNSSESYGLNGLATELQRAFRNGSVLLLLDGLDEVSNPTIRTHIAKAVASLCEHTRSYVVVTCRIRSFVAEIAEPFAEWGEPLTVAPFALGQMKHFIRGWYDCSVSSGVFELDEARSHANALIDRIVALPTLRDLGQTPLLLTLITILHFYEGKLPEDRADLYEDIVQLLLTRWTHQRREVGAPDVLLDRLKQDGSLGGLKDYHLRNVLEVLAYRAHKGQRSPDGRGLLERDIVVGALDRIVINGSMVERQ